jgi:hypothetical protein
MAMAVMGGSSAAVVGAPLERVRAFVQDVERAPQWQGGLTEMRALERDAGGRAVLCRAEADARVRTVRSVVRYSYDGPAALSWRQEQGDLKSAAGRWELEDLGGNRTRATYWLEVDPGRVLGLVIRGPLVDLLRDMMVGARAGELKRAVESG